MPAQTSLGASGRRDVVRAAFAANASSYLVLPIGSDAARVWTPSPPLGLGHSSASAETVYRDDVLQIRMLP